MKTLLTLTSFLILGIDSHAALQIEDTNEEGAVVQRQVPVLEDGEPEAAPVVANVTRTFDRATLRDGEVELSYQLVDEDGNITFESSTVPCQREERWDHDSDANRSVLIVQLYGTDSEDTRHNVGTETIENEVEHELLREEEVELSNKIEDNIRHIRTQKVRTYKRVGVDDVEYEVRDEPVLVTRPMTPPEQPVKPQPARTESSGGGHSNPQWVVRAGPVKVKTDDCSIM